MVAYVCVCIIIRFGRHFLRVFGSAQRFLGPGVKIAPNHPMLNTQSNSFGPIEEVDYYPPLLLGIKMSNPLSTLIPVYWVLVNNEEPIISRLINVILFDYFYSINLLSN